MEEIILYFSLKYQGDFNKIYKALETKEKVDETLKEELFKKLKSNYTTIVSKGYPERLKHISCPPFVLYYYGDLDLSCNECIGVIGKRVPSEYGESVTDKMVNKLVHNDYTIVSGMALGVDTIAHRSALKSNGKTIAVLGGGIDYCYPKRNQAIYQLMKNNHLVVSEYPNDTVPTAKNFPIRNRIIAGLSDSLLVTEAEIKSGTMITVGYAIEQGKDIFCIPGRIDDAKGCNYLIQQGAKLVINIDDIINE